MRAIIIEDEPLSVAELRTTLAVVTDYHLSCGRELTAAELAALRAASERTRSRQRVQFFFCFIA